jgi:hypothetical protein
VTSDAASITRRSVLAVGDAAAIVLFAVIGLANHREGIRAGGLARNTLPILGAWFALTPIVGTYSRPGLRTLLRTWALAVPIGVAVRAIALHRTADGSQAAFGVVTLIVTLGLLLAWRGVAAVIAPRRQSVRQVAP